MGGGLGGGEEEKGRGVMEESVDGRSSRWILWIVVEWKEKWKMNSRMKEG